MLTDQGVSVIIRVRPFSQREIRLGDPARAFDLSENSLQSLSTPPQAFTFDAVLSETASNSDAYEKMNGIVAGAMEGVNGTIFA